MRSCLRCGQDIEDKTAHDWGCAAMAARMLVGLRMHPLNRVLPTKVYLALLNRVWPFDLPERQP